MRFFYHFNEKWIVSSLIFAFGIGLIFLTFFSYNLLKNVPSKEAFTFTQREEWLEHPQETVINFASVPSTSLKIAYPADISQVIAVGFHEAENPKAYPLLPAFQCLSDETTESIRQIISSSKQPVFLILGTRNRRQLANTAADIAVKQGTVINSPVDGEVTKVKTYYLYGKHLDSHVEITPVSEPGLRVVLIHIVDVAVNVGDKVKRGKTPIGKVHPLYDKINSQINRYIPGKCDHVHVQVNPAEDSER